MLATNLKFLRKRRKKTQDDIAQTLGVPRATYNNYEMGLAEPKLKTLLLISDYFRFRIDDLVRKDLSVLPESKLRELEVQ